MKPLDISVEILEKTKHLLQAIKDGDDIITLTESRELHSNIREAEGFLMSSRKLLIP